jgi:hypothetical protein
MRHEVEDQGRPEFWYEIYHPVALARLGESEAALAMLQRSVANGHRMGGGWHHLEVEPAYEGLRRDPRFETLRAAVRRNTEEQRREVERRRADGRIPPRGESAHNTASATAHE